MCLGFGKEVSPKEVTPPKEVAPKEVTPPKEVAPKQDAYKNETTVNLIAKAINAVCQGLGCKNYSELAIYEGNQVTIDHSKFDLDMADRGTHNAEGSIFAFNLMARPANVPLAHTDVKDCSRQYFPGNEPPPGGLLLFKAAAFDVGYDDDLKELPEAERGAATIGLLIERRARAGKLIRIDPSCEYIRALLEKLLSICEDGNTALLKRWMKAMVVPIQFVHVTSMTKVSVPSWRRGQNGGVRTATRGIHQARMGFHARPLAQVWTKMSILARGPAGLAPPVRPGAARSCRAHIVPPPVLSYVSGEVLFPADRPPQVGRAADSGVVAHPTSLRGGGVAGVGGGRRWVGWCSGDRQGDGNEPRGEGAEQHPRPCDEPQNNTEACSFPRNRPAIRAGRARLSHHREFGKVL